MVMVMQVLGFPKPGCTIKVCSYCMRWQEHFRFPRGRISPSHLLFGNFFLSLHARACNERGKNNKKNERVGLAWSWCCGIPLPVPWGYLFFGIVIFGESWAPPPCPSSLVAIKLVLHQFRAIVLIHSLPIAAQERQTKGKDSQGG